MNNKTSRRPPRNPASVEVATDFRRALELHQQGQLPDAARLYRRVLQRAPMHFDAHHMLGLIEYQQRNFQGALSHLERALQLDPAQAPAHANLGNALRQLGRHDEALASLDRAIAVRPDYAAAHYNRGNVLLDLKRFDEALGSFDRALATTPDDPDTLYNRAQALSELQRYEEALATYDQVLARVPDDADTLCDRANALSKLRRPQEALASYDRALALRPDVARFHYNRGRAHLDLNDPAAALSSFDRALVLRPDDPAALYDRGQALFELKRYEEAAAAFDGVLALNPDHNYAKGEMLHAKLAHCDWRGYEQNAKAVIDAVTSGRRASVPFVFLSISASPRAQLSCAATYSRAEHPPAVPALWNGERYRHDKIRLAYLSADFHDHPVARQIARLFETHDKSRFQLTAISLGADRSDDIRARLFNAFDEVIDASQLDDKNVAAFIRDNEIDILIDLMGYTEGCRINILAARAAPIQVSYLGYLGTMGADYIDYIIADPVVAPENEQHFYTENVVHLPDTFLPTDPTRKIGSKAPTRAEAGLPEAGFIFCSFNNSYKLAPPIFDVWMRLLHQVEGSVLWLVDDDAASIRNRRYHAKKRGIDPDRLIFAARLPPQDHLARQRLVGLFLDTLPYNAGATACDALWAGLPVITCRGSSFVGRMAASQLYALGLPELVTESLTDYEALALRLAQNPVLLAGIKAKLAHNRATFPLFDADRYRRHLENAYEIMWERYQRGEPPASFAVAPNDGDNAGPISSRRSKRTVWAR